MRKYTNEQISREKLETILEAGNFAPNAGGGQRSMMVAIHDKELASHVGKMNMANFDRTNLGGSFVSKEQSHSKPRKPGRIKAIE
ncbi:nitroreductase family protein [Anaerostipes sp. 494a]|uniref:nitroreductase family protein n=1 Tax=Anaerostipes sp. 494a TaxID=1261636 RepID=UPI0009FA1382|nr:nitroreductase family protein [Anaerostipes sp. 494a]